MTVAPIFFDFGLSSPVVLDLASSEGLAPLRLPVPSEESVEQFRCFMKDDACVPTDRTVLPESRKTEMPAAFEPRRVVEQPTVKPIRVVAPPVVEPSRVGEQPVAEPSHVVVPPVVAPGLVAEPRGVGDQPVAEAARPAAERPFAGAQGLEPISTPCRDGVPSPSAVIDETAPLPRPVGFAVASVVERPVAEPGHVAEQQVIVPGLVAEPRGVVEQPVAEARPVAERPIADARPVVEQPTVEPSRVVAGQSAAEARPVAERPIADARPVVEQPTVEPSRVVAGQQTTAEQAEVISKPGRDEARPSHDRANMVQDVHIGRDGLYPVRNGAVSEASRPVAEPSLAAEPLGVVERPVAEARQAVERPVVETRQAVERNIPEVRAADAPEVEDGREQVVLHAAPVADASSAASPVAVDQPQAAGRADAASARTETIAETVNQIAETVVERIYVTPSLAHGEGEIRITLRPTVLDGSAISISAKDGTLSVSLAPATPEAARVAAAALPDLEAALAAHAPAFHHVAVVIATAKKEKTNEAA